MAKQSIIYLDNNATTRIDPAVVEAMMPYLTGEYGNPSSAYGFGSRVARAVENARESVAALLGCEPGEILFTSCGTESNNAAISSALANDPDRQHVVTTAVEHSAIIKQCEALARKGVEVTFLPVNAQGALDLDELADAIRPDTAIVSIMWANNETGVLFPVEEIAAIARARNVLFHTDAVQAVGKIPIRLAEARIPFLSLSGHKLHCPKGVGALRISRRTRFQPFLIGGSQEEGRRGGTENVAGIVALGKAAELAAAGLEHENTQVRALRDRFEETALANIPGTQVNGDREHRLPNTSNLAFDGIESEALLLLLDREGICCSAGSACTAGSIHPSHVLRAMGCSAERARSSLRFSFSRFNTAEETTHAAQVLARVVEKLRAAAGAGV